WENMCYCIPMCPMKSPTTGGKQLFTVELNNSKEQIRLILQTLMVRKWMIFLKILVKLLFKLLILPTNFLHEGSCSYFKLEWCSPFKNFSALCYFTFQRYCYSICC